MKFLISILFVCVTTFNVFAEAADNFRIVIDPGHGGNDLGAVRDSFIESKIVLDISQKVRTELERLKFKDIHLTREKNETLSLKDRVQKANEIGADLFISLHANTSNLSTLSGMEFYFNSAQSQFSGVKSSNTKLSNNEVLSKIRADFNFYEKTEKSLILSKAVQNSTLAGTQKSVIKRAPFYVIENTNMPSILIELGFISNRREAKKLTSEDYQNEIAKLIAEAIVMYKEKSDKSNTL